MPMGPKTGSAWSVLTITRTADAMNHAIPTDDELSQAVSALTAAGLVSVDGTRTRLTAGGSDIYREINSRPTGHIQRMIDLDHEWAAAQYPPRAERTWEVSPHELDRAVRAHVERFRRQLAEVEDEERRA